MTTEGWNVIDAEGAVLWGEYAFNKGAFATTLVFKGADGLVVVSPGSDVSDRDYDALAEHGEVRALVANNTLHNLGQVPWRKRFPNAESYASAGALPALQKKLPQIPFRPVESLAATDRARFHPLPGCKNGELQVTVRTPVGAVWYTGDVLTNLQRVKPPVSWALGLTKSGPGFSLFRLGIMLFANNKPALRAELLRLLEEAPPSIIVPGHGPAFRATDLVHQARTQIERL